MAPWDGWWGEPMRIRVAEAADAPVVAEIVRAACAAGTQDGFVLSGATETADNVLADLVGKEVYLLYSQSDGCAVGTLRLHAPQGADYLYVTRVAVRPEWQRLGVASRLLAFAEAQAARRGLRALRLDTPRDHSRLVWFYRRHGFAPAEQTVLPGRPYTSLILERVVMARPVASGLGAALLSS